MGTHDQNVLLQVKEVFLYKHEEYKHKGFFGQEAFEVELVEVKLHPGATIQGKMVRLLSL